MSRLSHFLTKVAPAGFLVGILVGVVGTVSVSAAMKGSLIFGDVPNGAFYDNAVGELYSLGIVKGKSATSYDPDAPVTRGEVAVLLQRLRNDIKGISNGASSSSYSTVSSSSSSSSTSTAAGTLQFAADKFAINKNAPKASFNVVRKNGTKGAVTVKYKTVDGSAVAGTNYVSNQGTISFANGEDAQTIYIQLKSGTPEGYNKDFTVELSDATGGASIGTPNVMKVQLLDVLGQNPSSSSSSTSSGGSSSSSTSSVAGAAVQLSASTYSVNETSGTITINVVRTGPTGAAATVNYATSNRTAEAGTEYASTNGTLSFSAGETQKSFVVSVINRPSIDGNKTFNVTLSAPSGLVLGNPTTAIVTVVDNDSVSITGSGTFILTADHYTGTKGNNAAITVLRNGTFTGTATVAYTTNNVSALVNADYTQTSGTLTFAPGETAKVILVPVLAGATSGRDFNVALSSPSNATMGTPNIAVIHID